MTSDPVSPSELFDCRKCGECCQGYGGTYLAPEDIEAISDYLGMDPKLFLSDYCLLSGGKLVLAQGKEGWACLNQDGV